MPQIPHKISGNQGIMFFVKQKTETGREMSDQHSGQFLDRQSGGSEEHFSQCMKQNVPRSSTIKMTHEQTQVH